MTEPTNPPDQPEAQPKSPSRRRRWQLIGGAVLLIPILLFALYLAAALNWSYSDGDRSGTLYKFSRKGWLCKTWEGELNITPTAAAPTIWKFTVRDDQVARRVNEALGQYVVLHYEEHRGIPTTCFGETSYYVDAVRLGKP